MRSIVPLLEVPRTARGCARGATGTRQDSVLSQVTGPPVRKLRNFAEAQTEIAIEVLSGYERSVHQARGRTGPCQPWFCGRLVCSVSQRTRSAFQ